MPALQTTAQRERTVGELSEPQPARRSGVPLTSLQQEEVRRAIRRYFQTIYTYPGMDLALLAYRTQRVFVPIGSSSTGLSDTRRGVGTHSDPTPHLADQLKDGGTYKDVQQFMVVPKADIDALLHSGMHGQQTQALRFCLILQPRMSTEDLARRWNVSQRTVQRSVFEALEAVARLAYGDRWTESSMADELPA